MKQLVLVPLFISVLALPAFSADITGSVSVKGKKSGKLVVYLEGVKGAKAPTKKPKIAQKGTKFTPNFMVVVAGQTVEMPNDDKIAHNVFSPSKTKKFNLGIYPKGTSKSVKFDKVGSVNLLCSIHRKMRAKIIVVPNKYYAVTKPGGKFTIKNVPPGKYTLKVKYKKKKSSKTVNVSKKSLTVNFSL